MFLLVILFCLTWKKYKVRMKCFCRPVFINHIKKNDYRNNRRTLINKHPCNFQSAIKTKNSIMCENYVIPLPPL